MSDNSLLEKLEVFYIRFREIGQLITDPEVIQDMNRFVKLNKEYRELEQIVEAGDELKSAVKSYDEAQEILNTENDKELREMAEMEIEELEAKAGLGWVLETEADWGAEEDALIQPIHPERRTVLITDLFTAGVAEELADLASRSPRCTLVGRQSSGRYQTCNLISVVFDDMFQLDYPISRRKAWAADQASGVRCDLEIEWTPQECDEDLLMIKAKAAAKAVDSF